MKSVVTFIYVVDKHKWLFVVQIIKFRPMGLALNQSN